MLLRSIVSEAWRNIASGTSRTLMFSFIMVFTVGLSAVFNCLVYSGQVSAAVHWRQAGASTHIVQVQGRIDGAKCDSLAQIPDINQAGAMRQAQSVALAQLPSNPLVTLEGSPGFMALLAANRSWQGPGQGVWVASDLAKDLDRDGKPTQLFIASQSDNASVMSPVSVAGVYQHQEDGRQPILAYNLVSPVSAKQSFDSCWVEIWPESKNLESLLSYPIIPAANKTEPQIQQFNGTLGRSFQTSRGQSIPPWVFLIISTLAGALIGAWSGSMRKLEIASQLHAGVDKASTVIQHALEHCAALLICAAVTGATLSVLGATNYTPHGDVWAVSLGTLLGGTSASLIANITTVALTKEKRLFSYFKTR